MSSLRNDILSVFAVASGCALFAASSYSIPLLTAQRYIHDILNLQVVLSNWRYSECFDIALPRPCNMVPRRLTAYVYAAMAVLLAGATAVDITAELNSGWAMGLRPRQEGQNLQAFSGAVGGVGASAVCFYYGGPSHGRRILTRPDHGLRGPG